MNFVERHPFVDPDAAARKLIEIAKDVEAVQDGRIFIEPVNEPFLAGRKWRAVPRCDRACHCARLVMAARNRHVCEVHSQRRGADCLARLLKDAA